VSDIDDLIKALREMGIIRSLTMNACTQADPGAITCTTNHLLETGDTVRITDVVGMTQLNDQEFTIATTSATTFTIGVDTRGYDAYVSGGTVTHT